MQILVCEVIITHRFNRPDVSCDEHLYWVLLHCYYTRGILNANLLEKCHGASRNDNQASFPRTSPAASKAFTLGHIIGKT